MYTKIDAILVQMILLKFLLFYYGVEFISPEDVPLYDQIKTG